MKDPSEFRSHRTVSISDNRRPIYGVLTEPLRGNLKNKKKDSGDYFDHSSDEVSYIPKAHVQFLEQSGIAVMPISYLDDKKEIKNFLREVNGVYICGDSHKAIANEKYQESFETILDFVVTSNKEDEEYFPIFMMGKSAQSLVRKLGLSHSVL